MKKTPNTDTDTDMPTPPIEREHGGGGAVQDASLAPYEPYTATPLPKPKGAPSRADLMAALATRRRESRLAPSDRRDKQVQVLMSALELSALKTAAHENRVAVGAYIREAVALLIRTRTSLRALAAIPSAPLTAESLAKSGTPRTVQDASPSPSPSPRVPQHCGFEMAHRADGSYVCLICGPALD